MILNQNVDNVKFTRIFKKKILGFYEDATTLTDYQGVELSFDEIQYKKSSPNVEIINYGKKRHKSIV